MKLNSRTGQWPGKKLVKAYEKGSGDKRTGPINGTAKKNIEERMANMVKYLRGMVKQMHREGQICLHPKVE